MEETKETREIRNQKNPRQDKNLYATKQLSGKQRETDPFSVQFFLSRCVTGAIEPHNFLFALHFTSNSFKKRIDNNFLQDIAALRWILLYISTASSSGHIRVNKSVFLEETKALFNSPLTKIDPEIEKQLINADKKLNQGDIISHHPKLFGQISTPPVNIETPIILSDDLNFFYTNKLYRLETRFLDQLSKRCTDASTSRENPPYLSDKKIKTICNKIVAKGNISSEDEIIYEAAKKAICYPLLAISGGPGTGKTTMVTYLLEILKEISKEEGATLRVALCAPTGRAASRIKESLQQEFSDTENISQEAFTLHKLLKLRPGCPSPYKEDNTLPFDLVIVDEASMIDLTLMTTLLQALSPETGLILVGDKDQLPSVETGALLADILYKYEDPGHKLHKQVIILKKVFRSEKTIIALANKVINGNTKETLSILQNAKNNPQQSIGWHNLTEMKLGTSLDQLLLSQIPSNRSGKVKNTTQFNCSIEKREEVMTQINEAFIRAEKSIILSPLRRSPYGTERTNKMLDHFYSTSEGSTPYRDNQTGLYHFKKIIITRNDYNLGLYNGDRGIIFQFQKSFYAFFKTGIDETGKENYNHYPVSHLTHYESANAITIHKSQGSEWEEVHIILPKEADKLLKREMFYTALTRAKKRAVIYSTEEAITQTVAGRVIRNSGVRKFVLN